MRQTHYIATMTIPQIIKQILTKLRGRVSFRAVVPEDASDSEEMAQCVKGFLHKHEHVGSNPRTQVNSGCVWQPPVTLTPRKWRQGVSRASWTNRIREL